MIRSLLYGLCGLFESGFAPSTASYYGVLHLAQFVDAYDGLMGHLTARQKRLVKCVTGLISGVTVHKKALKDVRNNWITHLQDDGEFAEDASDFVGRVGMPGDPAAHYEMHVCVIAFIDTVRAILPEIDEPAAEKFNRTCDARPTYHCVDLDQVDRNVRARLEAAQKRAKREFPGMPWDSLLGAVGVRLRQLGPGALPAGLLRPRSGPAPRAPRAARPPPAWLAGLGSSRDAPMSAERYARSDLSGTDSDYLCLFCYEPLYVDMATMKEACLNRGCTCYTGRGEITGNLAEHDGPRRAKKLYAESVREFHKFDRRFLLQKIHEARAAECAKFLLGNGMNIGILASLDHLLIQLHGNAEWGDSRDSRACRAAFDDYYEKFEILQLAEDICSKYYVTNANAQPLVIKYHHAIREFFKTLGIVSGDDRQNRAATLPFYHIDKKSMDDPAKSVFDFEAIYKNSLPLANALNHAFKMRYSTSKMYAYPDRSADFAALLSLWTTCPPGSARTVTTDRLREIYDGTVKKNKMDGDFDQFLEDCTSGRTYAPILVFDGEKYRFDYATLLLYLVYMFSNNRSRSGTQTEAGRTTHDKRRHAAADYFEDQIRQKLRDDGLDVYPRQGGKPLNPSFDNVRKEFDCVAVDRERKIIVIVEAKYEDMAPSSMAPGTMVGQLVLDRKTGLLAHAKRHHSRREFFKRNFDGMRRRGLDLPGDFIDYTVYTLLVTKHEPLISRHMAVDILSYEKFTSIDFRSTTARDDLDGAAGGLPGRQPGAAATGGPARPARGGGGAGSPRRPGRGRRG